MLAALTMEKARGKAVLVSRGAGAPSRPLTPQDRAERQLAAIERFLTRAYLDACEAGRKAVPEETLERFIAEASGAGLLKADAPATPELAWNLTANLDFRVLGQSYEIVTVSVERFDEIWQKDGAFYVPPSSAIAGPALTEAIARSARAGVFVPPPVVADLSGEGRFAFLNGRNAYLYTRSSGYETIPLAVSRRDAARLKTRAGNEPHLGSAATGGDAFPVGSLSRPYADLSDAIEYVASIVADRFFSAVLAGAIAVGEREAVRLAGLLDARSRTAKSAGADGAGFAAAVFSKLETALDFETPNYGALAELQRSAMNLIREFTEEQRGVVLAALRDGVERGINPREMARIFRGSIGLTRIQEGWVENYRNALNRIHLDANAQANALGRALHDNRFNSTLATAARTGVALTPEKIERMVEIYQGRFIAYRAETIARTQGLRAVNMAEQAVWDEAVRRGDVKANEVECTWMTARDERVRASHRAMNGQKRMMGKPFLSGALNALRFPGDPLAPPAEVCNCRCTLGRNLTAEPIVEVINDGVTIAGDADPVVQQTAEDIVVSQMVTVRPAEGLPAVAEVRAPASLPPKPRPSAKPAVPLNMDLINAYQSRMEAALGKPAFEEIFHELSADKLMTRVQLAELTSRFVSRGGSSDSRAAMLQRIWDRHVSLAWAGDPHGAGFPG